MRTANPSATAKPSAPDRRDDEDDDWPTPEAREAARRHDASTDDNPLESIGKAVSAPVLGAADPDADEPAERKP